ncbi:MAG: hypothetical protein WBF48_10740 [Halarcobacter sp.]
MYSIYFKNETSEYQYPIRLYGNDRDKLLDIIHNFWDYVPSIQVCDGYDCSILEINDKVIVHGENIELTENNHIEFDYEKLLKNYIKYTNTLSKTKNNILIMKDIEIKLLAYCAKKNIVITDSLFKPSDTLLDRYNIDIDNLDITDDIFDKFKESLEHGESLIIMPLSRILFEQIIDLDEFLFIPPRKIDYNLFFTLDTPNSPQSKLTFAQSSLTLFDFNILYNSHCIAFSYNIDWSNINNLTHGEHITIIKKLSSKVERLFDLIRFSKCELHLSDTLMGEAGCWYQSDDYQGALLHTRTNTRLLSGSAIEGMRVVKGVGLDFSYTEDVRNLLALKNQTGGVASVLNYSLRLLSDAMYSNNLTMKYIRMMTLIEYLASPFEYMKFQDAKRYVICHSASDKTDYFALSKEFMKLSKDYRTALVHNGKTLEDIITNYDERINLLKNIEKYCKKAIFFLLESELTDWEDIMDERKTLIQNLTQ